MGIDLRPYWIEREGLDLCPTMPSIKGSVEDFHFQPIESEIIHKFFEEKHWGSSAWETSEQWKSIAYGLIWESEIAAFVMVRSRQFEYRGKVFELRNHEAYIENMYTIHKFRGQNLAPYLCYLCYQALAEKGVTVCYSITQYFNRSALRYKAKLGTRHKALYLYTGLFNRLGRTFKLRSYKYG